MAEKEIPVALETSASFITKSVPFTVIVIVPSPFTANLISNSAVKVVKTRSVAIPELYPVIELWSTGFPFNVKKI